MKDKFKELMSVNFHDQIYRLNKALAKIKQGHLEKKKCVTFAD